MASSFDSWSDVSSRKPDVPSVDYEAQLAQIRRLRAEQAKEYEELKKLPATKVLNYQKEKLDWAATVIQSRWRGCRARKQYCDVSLKSALLRDKSARKIQKFLRDNASTCHGKRRVYHPSGVSIEETPATPIPRGSPGTDSEKPKRSFEQSLNWIEEHLSTIPPSIIDTDNAASMSSLVDRLVVHSESSQNRREKNRRLGRLLRDLSSTSDTILEEMRKINDDETSEEDKNKSVRWLRSGSKIVDNVAKMRHEIIRARLNRYSKFGRSAPLEEDFDFFSPGEEAEHLEKLVSLKNL